MSKKIAVFSGTGEGRQLAEWVTERNMESDFTFFVATEYGGEMMKDLKDIHVHEGRLTPEDMDVLFRAEGFSLVVDATHPYATKVTENIRKSCEGIIPYVRLFREPDDSHIDDLQVVEDITAAAELLNCFDDKVLLTTGSKEINKFSSVKDKKRRLIARVLPTIESLNLCFNAGIENKNIIAMQGPFTKEMNIATMNQYGCSVLVTKDTGTMGGFHDKASLVELGYKVIIIKRPTNETGLTFEQVKERILDVYKT